MKVAVTIDTAPQAYFRLERTATEQEQNFSTLKHPVPTNLYHLGIDAYWLPLTQQVMTTDGVRLITATINWPGANTAQNIKIGEATARVFLGRSNPKAIVYSGG